MKQISGSLLLIGALIGSCLLGSSLFLTFILIIVTCVIGIRMVTMKEPGCLNRFIDLARNYYNKNIVGRKSSWAFLEAILLGCLLISVFLWWNFFVTYLEILVVIVAPWVSGYWIQKRCRRFQFILAILSGIIIGVIGYFWRDKIINNFSLNFVGYPQVDILLVCFLIISIFASMIGNLWAKKRAKTQVNNCEN